MKRTALWSGCMALGILGVARGAVAQSQIAIYGSMDAGVAYVSNNGGASQFKFNQSNMQPDRWGLRGVEDLGGGNQAIFRLENGFFTGTGSAVSSTVQWNRQAYVGLRSASLGTLTLGHQSALMFDLLTPLSNAFTQSSFNAFHPGNIDGLGNTAASALDNAVKYRSPNYHGITFHALVGLGNTSNFAYGNTMSVGIDYQRGPLAMAAVYANQHNRAFAIAQMGLTVFQGRPAATYVADHSQTWGAGAAYRFGAVRVHALYTGVRLQNGEQTDTFQSYEAGAEYHWGVRHTINAGAASSSLAGHRWTQCDVGYIYAFSKVTQWYLQGLYEHANAGTNAALLTAGVSSGRNQLMVVSGIHHLF